MKTPLVLLNLLHQPLRTVVAILGVAFAVLLLFMQLGFYGSAEDTATTFFEALDFDFILISSNYLNSSRPRSFPLARLYQALEHRDVATVSPLYIDWQNWRILDRSPQRHQRRAILALAFRLDEPVFRIDRVFKNEPAETCRRRLQMPDTVLVDTATRDYFGPRGVGVRTELSFKNIEVVGQFTIGTGFAADGMVLTSERTYAHLSSPQALEHPALGLIRLRDRDKVQHRFGEIKKQLRTAFYSDGEVYLYSRDEIEKRERNYWLYRTSVGIIFTIGVFVALIVGVIFVYQVIATDIADHLAEYATLKAMGYSMGYLSGVVLRQALVLALLGYLPAFFAALGLYALGEHEAKLLLSMNRDRAAAVFLLAVAMCSLSGMLALRKLRAADPADLF